MLAPSPQPTLPSSPVNPTPFASVGQLSAAPQSGSSSGSSYPRKLTQRPEVAGILAPPAQAASPPPPSPTIGLSPTSLTFNGVQGGTNPSDQTVSVTNAGGGTMSWSAGSNAGWLILTTASGSTAPGTLTASVNLAGLAAGTYNATITVTAVGATNTPRTAPVTLTVTAAPVPPTIGLSPSNLSFTGVQGGANPSAQTVSVSNTGGGTLNWSVSDSAAWLTLSPASGTAPSSATASVSTSGLTAGTYNATITVAATGATNTPQTVPVTLTVTAAPVPPTIGLSPSSLSFTGAQGGANPANQTLSVTNTGGGTMSWSVSDNAAWLTLSPTSGSTTPGTVTVSVNLTGLTAGTYNATVTITATGATNTPQTVPVTLTVTAAPPTIGLSPTSFTFTGVQGGANPANQTLSVTNTGGGTMSWSVTDTATWLTLSPASGTAPGSATVSVNLTGLTAGTYNATVTITATGATNTPQTAPVTLTVTAAPATIGRNPASFTFTGVQGALNPANQTLSITNTGGGTLSWSVSDNASWLTVSPTSGTTTTETDSVTVSVNTASLATGTYNAAITITASGATNTPQTVPVTLIVAAPPTLGTATLTWNANTEPDLAGYQVYVGTASGVYGVPISVGNVTTYQVTNLTVGQTYYFAIKAVDTSNNESGYSNEVSKSVF